MWIQNLIVPPLLTTESAKIKIKNKKEIRFSHTENGG